MRVSPLIGGEDVRPVPPWATAGSEGLKLKFSHAQEATKKRPPNKGMRKILLTLRLKIPIPLPLLSGTHCRWSRAPAFPSPALFPFLQTAKHRAFSPIASKVFLLIKISPALAEAFGEPGGDVGIVPDDRVFRFLLRTQVSGEHLPGIDSPRRFRSSCRSVSSDG